MFPPADHSVCGTTTNAISTMCVSSFSAKTRITVRGRRTAWHSRCKTVLLSRHPCATSSKSCILDLGIEPSSSGNLQHWAQQGVLLLNTTLTVRSGMAASHHGRGWETFTDAIISLLDSRAEPIVFVLWGAHAQEKQILIQSPHHTVITSSHPSPLSAHRGFLGSRPFSAINSALINHGSTAIDWQLPNHTNRA